MKDYLSNTEDISSGNSLLGQKSPVDTVCLWIAGLLIVFIFVFYTLFSFIPIVGPSMENTIFDGQQCFVLRSLYSIGRGDLVTIDTADEGEEDHLIIKRIIATSGDRLVFMNTADGKNVDLYLCKDGESRFTLLDEDYVKEPMIPDNRNATHNVFTNIKNMRYVKNLTEIDLNGDIPSPIWSYMVTVGKNEVFVLGDNRNVSRDSRYYGALDADKITSKVLLII